jgi:hypothetical protein
MKFLILESKLESYVMSYLDSLPELNNLTLVEDNFFDWDQGVSVDVIFFESEPNFPMMEYYPLQSNIEGWNEVDLESQPILKMNADLKIKEMFGDNFEEFVKNWFEDKYKLPVKTVIF